MADYVLELDDVSKKFRRGEIHDSLRDQIPALVRSITRRAAPDASALGRQEFWALRNVDLKVERGEAVGIVGHNGAGKSTILKILTGIMNPTTGTKTVRGSLSALIEVGAGFHPDLTGRENIFLNGTVLGMKRAAIRERMDDIIEFSGLEAFIDTPVKRYSSGMFARLGFSIACHVNPDILIVDEVLSVGDWAFQNRSMEKMKEILGSGSTVIFVSHNLKAVTGLCKRAVLLDHGTVLADGNPIEIVDLYVKRASVDEAAEPDENALGVIDSVALRDASGQDASLFTAGDRAVVEVVVTSRSIDGAASVSISVRDEEILQTLFHIDTDLLIEGGLELAPGETRKLTFELDLHLAPGSYYLNAFLYRGETEYDARRPAARFAVQSDLDVRGVANLYPRLVSS